MPAEKKDPGAAKREKAVQDLAELSEELGLHDGELPLVQPMPGGRTPPLSQEQPGYAGVPGGACLFCGLDSGSCGHNPGGPA